MAQASSPGFRFTRFINSAIVVSLYTVFTLLFVIGSVGLSYLV